MKPKKNKETDIDKSTVFINIEEGVIERVRTGEITHLHIQIDEENQNFFLENVEGNLILATETMPTTFHGCYLYNNGEFPYFIQDSLEHIVLVDDADNYCATNIIDVQVEQGKRFKYQGKNQPIVENPDGDSCVWEVYFEVVPIPENPKSYLMRWNPSISSFTEKDYKDCVEKRRRGMFRINWSISEWEEARRGDLFYMMRVGDDKAGVVFKGQFLSDPYPDDDWAGSTKRRMYVDMICSRAVEPGTKPSLSLEKLQKAIPEIDWSKGHSGVLLPPDVEDKLFELFQEE